MINRQDKTGQGGPQEANSNIEEVAAISAKYCTSRLLHVTTICHRLHMSQMSGLLSKVTKQKFCLTKKNIRVSLYLTKTLLKSPQPMWAKCVIGLMKPTTYIFVR